ncbi:hypothetical protein ACP3XM_24915, partial [Salmonella enterica]|uniref:hypothetical protein n=1 Tax=Salmonella enterica TaxID=28901 RepID=UPI003CF78FFB
ACRNWPAAKRKPRLPESAHKGFKRHRGDGVCLSLEVVMVLVHPAGVVLYRWHRRDVVSQYCKFASSQDRLIAAS